MPRTALSSRGQIVIPAEIRRRRNLRPGARFEVLENGPDIVLHAISVPGDLSLDDLFGFLEPRGPALTEEEMQEAIRRGATESL
jgi:AbrB family looped-hinge helix DNA binding protein